MGKKLKWNDEERSGEDNEGRALAEALGPTLIPNKPLDQELTQRFLVAARGDIDLVKLTVAIIQRIELRKPQAKRLNADEVVKLILEVLAFARPHPEYH